MTHFHSPIHRAGTVSLYRGVPARFAVRRGAAPSFITGSTEPLGAKSAGRLLLFNRAKVEAVQ